MAVPPESPAVLEDLLDDEERERARRFRVAAARDRFVVAHAALRFVLGRLVGADVERVRRRTDVLSVARHALAPAERRAIESLATDGERRDAFFRCWTRKEAYLKARGQGLTAGMDSFSVAVGGDDWCRPHVAADPWEACRWRIRSLPTSPGYRAAIAAEGACELRSAELRLP